VPIALASVLIAEQIPGPESLKTGVLALLAAVGTWILSYFLNRREARVLVDSATGEKVVLRRGDSLFFLPVRFWPYLILAICAASIVMKAFGK
jgi:TRAP-type uncharacterized transport system fused permease subunit